MKITLIGAGSVVFSKTLVGDLLQFKELQEVTIALMDIDPKRLQVADLMMKKLVQALGVKAKIESTQDRVEAIRHAKYVICTIQVGGYDPATLTDFEIPKKYGLQQTIGDTLGIGGIFRGLRTIPEILKIAKDIDRFAHPNCLLLNYSNPMAMNCWAVNEAVGIQNVGLCHSVFGTARMLSKHANLNFDHVNYTVAGINHLAFFLKFEYLGQDAYPLLFKILEDPERNFEKVRYEMMRRTGYFITESSEHLSEYLPYFIHHGEKMIQEFEIPIDEYLRRCKSIIATWEESEKELLGDGKEIEVRPQSHEYGSYIIHSIETNTLRTIYGNISNQGNISNLPQGCCIEIPCQVDANGISPTSIGSLPSHLAALCQTNINVQKLTVEAALSSRREHIYHAAMVDPHTSVSLPLDKIWAMCDDLIEEHQKNGFLQEFEPTLKHTGKSAKGFKDRIILRLENEAFDASQGGESEIRLTIENPTSKPFTFRKNIVFDSNLLQIKRGFKETLTPPYSKEEHLLSVETLKPIQHPISVEIENEELHVLAVGTQLNPRDMLHLYEKRETEFEIFLSGFVCAQGKISSDGEHLRISMKVLDSDICPNYTHPSKSSCSELFFAPLQKKQQIAHLIIIPEKEGSFGIRDLSNQFEEIKIEAQKVTEMYYSYQISIPLSPLSIDLNSPFLFDSITHLNALGDAHSGGRASLNDKFNSHSQSGHFSLVQPKLYLKE